MTMRPEVKILNQGLYGRNLTPTTQVRWGGELPLKAVRLGAERCRSEEAIGATPCRAKAKRRKALTEGEPASSGEARFPWVRSRVVATAWGRRRIVLPGEICRVPPQGGRPSERKDASR